jgi:hypothetical protein
MYWIKVKAKNRSKQQTKKPSKPAVLAYFEGFFGGAGRDRTDDPQTASLMLSQLSYSPIIQSL